MDVSTILESLRQLTDDQFKDFMYRAMEQDRPADVKHQVTRHFGRRAKSWAKHGAKGGVPVECDPTGCHPNKPRPTTSTEPSEAAFKNPFIYRSDLVPSDGVVFFDVEKLSLKKSSANQKHKQVASSVAVVNDNRDLILWSFINWKEICQTFPGITGITKEKLNIGLDISVVQPFADMAFKGNRVVGWDLLDDLNALFVSSTVTKYDLAEYFSDENGQKYRLKDIHAHFF